MRALALLKRDAYVPVTYEQNSRVLVLLPMMVEFSLVEA